MRQLVRRQTALPLVEAEGRLNVSIASHDIETEPFVLQYSADVRGVLPPLSFCVGPYASIHVIERVEERSAFRPSISFDIGEGATVHYTSLVLDVHDVESSLNAAIQQGGRLLCCSAVANSSYRFEAHVELQGEGGEVSFSGLSLVSSRSNVSQTVFVDHQSPRTSSHQLMKGLVVHDGRGAITSHVRIRPEAVGSVSRQYSHFLTIGALAKTSQHPHFEILTDDVTASHGASTGVIDEEAIFYLQARGLSARDARQHIVDGFCEEILRRLPCTESQLMANRIFRIEANV